MADEFGDVDSKDLNNLRDFFMSEIEKLSDTISSIMYNQQNGATYDAQVFKYVEKGSDLEKLYGYGAVQVIIPFLNIGEKSNVYCKPLRLLQGRFEIPPLESWVKVCSVSPDNFTDFYYYGAMFLDRKDYLSSYTSSEEVGFQPQIPQVKNVQLAQSAAIDNVRSNPGKYRIIESSKNMIISEDTDEKILQVAVNDGWKLNIEVGDLAEVNIVNVNPMTGAPGTGAAFKIDMGTTGSVEIISGTADTESTILGETLKDLLNDLVTAIKAITVPTALGPSGTPINSAQFTQLANRLDDILSEYNKNN